MKNLFATLIMVVGTASLSYSQQTYQLQIFKGSMEDVKKEHASFQEKYSDIKASLAWESPYAYLSVGACDKKNDALKLQKKLKAVYPTSIIVKCDDK